MVGTWGSSGAACGPVDYRHQMVYKDKRTIKQPNPSFASGNRVYRPSKDTPWHNPSPFYPDYANPYDLIPTGEYTVRGRAFTVTQAEGGGKTGEDLVLCTLQ